MHVGTAGAGGGGSGAPDGEVEELIWRQLSAPGGVGLVAADFEVQVVGAF